MWRPSPPSRCARRCSWPRVEMASLENTHRHSQTTFQQARRSDSRSRRGVVMGRCHCRDVPDAARGDSRTRTSCGAPAATSPRGSRNWRGTCSPPVAFASEAGRRAVADMDACASRSAQPRESRYHGRSRRPRRCMPPSSRWHRSIDWSAPQICPPARRSHDAAGGIPRFGHQGLSRLRVCPLHHVRGAPLRRVARAQLPRAGHHRGRAERGGLVRRSISSS